MKIIIRLEEAELEMIIRKYFKDPEAVTDIKLHNTTRKIHTPGDVLSKTRIVADCEVEVDENDKKMWIKECLG